MNLSYRALVFSALPLFSTLLADSSHAVDVINGAQPSGCRVCSTSILVEPSGRSIILNGANVVAVTENIKLHKSLKPLSPDLIKKVEDAKVGGQTSDNSKERKNEILDSDASCKKEKCIKTKATLFKSDFLTIYSVEQGFIKNLEKSKVLDLNEKKLIGTLKITN